MRKANESKISSPSIGLQIWAASVGPHVSAANVGPQVSGASFRAASVVSLLQLGVPGLFGLYYSLYLVFFKYIAPEAVLIHEKSPSPPKSVNPPHPSSQNLCSRPSPTAAVRPTPTGTQDYYLQQQRTSQPTTMSSIFCCSTWRKEALHNCC
uniref:Uncharacterized protein n=1 Tax=Ditylenchus dipsaci TaxID=166011 RepID=A0A915EEQ5_9BILA